MHTVQQTDTSLCKSQCRLGKNSHPPRHRGKASAARCAGREGGGAQVGRGGVEVPGSGSPAAPPLRSAPIAGCRWRAHVGARGAAALPTRAAARPAGAAGVAGAAGAGRAGLRTPGAARGQGGRAGNSARPALWPARPGPAAAAGAGELFGRARRGGAAAAGRRGAAAAGGERAAAPDQHLP